VGQIKREPGRSTGGGWCHSRDSQGIPRGMSAVETTNRSERVDPRLTPMPCPPPWRVHGVDTGGLPDLGGWDCWRKQVTQLLPRSRRLWVWCVTAEAMLSPSRTSRQVARPNAKHQTPISARHAMVAGDWKLGPRQPPGPFACLTESSHVTRRLSPVEIVRLTGRPSPGWPRVARCAARDNATT
jgi:hypothetical protein